MPRKIVAKVSDGGINKIKQELKTLKESRPDISISSIRIGSLGDDDVISFNVNENYYQVIVDQLTSLGVNLLIPVEKRAKEKIVSLRSNNPANKDTLSSTNSRTAERQNSDLSLETAINNGDYETVIKISKDVRNKPDIINKAKDNLYNTVIGEIERLYQLGNRSRIERKECIERLVKIASDSNIRAMNNIDALKLAGSMAVKLCALPGDYVISLIQLCNNNVVPNIVSVKAAVVLSGLILNESEKSKENLEYAIKRVNIRWLLIAYDVVMGELSMEEKGQFFSLINIIKENR